MDPALRLTLHGPYTLVALVANLALILLLHLVTPMVVDLHAAHGQQLPGLVELWVAQGITFDGFVLVLFIGQLLALVRGAPRLYHGCMALALFTLLIAALTLFTATLLPALRLLATVSA